MSYKFSIVHMNKWHIAVLFGTSLAIGAGYYAYNKLNTTPDGSNSKESLNDQKKTVDSSGNKGNGSLEKSRKNSDLENVKLTPLREALLYKEEGNNCYRNGKFDEAISFYDKAIDKCPVENAKDLAVIYQNRAAAYEMLRKWNAVKDDCTKSLEYDSRYSKAYFRRAKAYEAMNNMNQCLEDITAACIFDTFKTSSFILYADRMLKQSGRDDTEKAMKDKVPILPSKNFITTYLRSFASDPIQNTMMTPRNTEEPLWGYERAQKALQERDFDDIIAACTEEIQSDKTENKMEALLMRGTFHLISGSFNQAKNDFDTIINNNQADVQLRVYALIRRASLHIQLERKDDGFADFAEVEKLSPENPDLYHQRAQTYILFGQLTEALQEFEKAVKLAPDNALAFVQKCYAQYRLAVTNQDQMRLIMVLNEFKNAVEKFPNCVECYSLLAQLLSEQQEFQQADDYYLKAIKLAPDNAALLVHRGILQLQWKADIQEAINLIQKAIEMDDRCELAYETLGTLEVQRANLERAIELFEEAIKLAKTQMDLYHLYGLRNAAMAQLSVTRKFDIDISKVISCAQSAPVITSDQLTK